MIASYHLSKKAFSGGVLALTLALNGGSAEASVTAQRKTPPKETRERLKERSAEKLQREDSAINKNTAIRLLTDISTVYEQYLQKGSASSLNHIATTYYVLAENESEKSKIVEHYKMAAHYFEEAADAGCGEARYNAGLVRSKLEQYVQAVAHYRTCCQESLQKDTTSLILKAALNWVVLISGGHVQPSQEDVTQLLELAQGYIAKFSDDETPEGKENKKRAMEMLGVLMVYVREKLEKSDAMEASSEAGQAQ